jgi:hypothetical protein
MLPFDSELFERKLKDKIPNAQVTIRILTPEQREAKREHLHNINALQSKSPAIGYGALNK